MGSRSRVYGGGVLVLISIIAMAFAIVACWPDKGLTN
jgi:hypothetical protein